MKKDDTALILDSGKENNNHLIIRWFLSILFLGVLGFQHTLFSAVQLKGYTIEEIYIKANNKTDLIKNTPYHPLVYLKPGDFFNYQDLQKSIRNLYKTGNFDNIEIRVKKKNGNKIDIYMNLQLKFTISSIKIKQIHKFNGLLQEIPFTIFKKKELKKSLFSIRQGSYLEKQKLPKIIKKIEQFFKSQGYYNAKITYELEKNRKNLTAVVKFLILLGEQARIKKLNLKISPVELEDRIGNFFTDFPTSTSQTSNNISESNLYFPIELQKNIEQIKKILKKDNYYFPTIKLSEEFIDSNLSLLNLNLKIDAGYRYSFKFKGIKNQMKLISSIWENKVFEKWAERESKARILTNLKQKGFFAAQVNSQIDKNTNIKIITFNVKKGKQYSLGKILFNGNQSASEEELLKIITIDDKVFERLFYLRLVSLMVDLELLKLYYNSLGYSNVSITTDLKFKKKKIDVTFIIKEGKKFIVDTLLYEGNQYFSSQTLNSFMKTKVKEAFVLQFLYKDIENLKRIYHTNGFNKIEIFPEISPGTEKSILIKIKEGKAYQMGNLIIIGASKQHRKLIKSLFPFKTSDPFDQFKINAFKNNIESNSIFNQFDIIKIERAPNLIDILIKINPDHSTFYGFGIGWEERKGLRGTLEYQRRNILKTYSSFSAMFQLGRFEMRGLISLDTPYFFKTQMNASLKLWLDNEIYPSYKFERYGLGETLIKRLNSYSYLMGSISWYRTTLKELRIVPQGVDQLGVPFDTTALNLSYVREKRDDPFNPTQGNFFSSDLKIGLPIFEKDYSFIKFRWSFQKNFKILKHGIFSASIRNGLATGNMSITERFFAGGLKTFRGTHRDQLGPMDPTENMPKGGNMLLLFNFETTFPFQIIPIRDLYYSFFTDIGNVFENIKSFDLSKLKTAFGFSLKYKTPMGPLRLDIGWNLATWEPKLHIGIGNVL